MVRIISRSEWGARAPRDRSYVSWSQRTEVVVHHSAGPTTQTVRSIQDFHLDGRGWSDIGYNLLVDDDGAAYEGRGWTVAGAHAVGHNTSGIGICYIGQNSPTPAAKATIRALYDEASERAGRALPKRTHGDVNSTSCPGSNLQSWVDDGMPGGVGVIEEAMNMIINLRKGDGSETGKREHVKFLQIVLKEQGQDVGEYGVDGEYGGDVESAVLGARQAEGSEQDFGDWVSGWAAKQIIRGWVEQIVRDTVGSASGGALPDTVDVSGKLRLTK
ncbi:N-acetylmuramoyl-L-alanine amidase [Streptomonospora wellingtoniae]|uniref:N-acetylmuramoyl-L-alanine amidase n=1 Tax=Streptomonospora wellingtoniae TaxID=3075544 RepID=A0ABU2L136_9ACTN|nr:N-acetylmuramoyl-L-alanine amidase [Streptomonospora sp. DSM 45055]MDT0305053.1 N-acetylmuramoyl-L-alanine amidase [Streptomonospora sp. DSM 45055]